MPKKPKIYYCHPMEIDEAGLLDDSIKRGEEAEKLIGEYFEFWLPERNQVHEHGNQEKVDLDALIECDIILVDLYHFKLTVNDKKLYGKGTSQETGFVKALNKLRKKHVPIVQIIRQSKNLHCFDKEDTPENYGVTKNCQSLPEACEYIKKEFKK